MWLCDDTDDFLKFIVIMFTVFTLFVCVVSFFGKYDADVSYNNSALMVTVLEVSDVE